MWWVQLKKPLNFKQEHQMQRFVNQLHHKQFLVVTNATSELPQNTEHLPTPEFQPSQVEFLKTFGLSSKYRATITEAFSPIMIIQALEAGGVLYATEVEAELHKTEVGGVYVHGLSPEVRYFPFFRRFRRSEFFNLFCRIKKG